MEVCFSGSKVDMSLLLMFIVIIIYATTCDSVGHKMVVKRVNKSAFTNKNLPHLEAGRMMSLTKAEASNYLGPPDLDPEAAHVEVDDGDGPDDFIDQLLTGKTVASECINFSRDVAKKSNYLVHAFGYPMVTRDEDEETKTPVSIEDGIKIIQPEGIRPPEKVENFELHLTYTQNFIRLKTTIGRIGSSSVYRSVHFHKKQFSTGTVFIVRDKKSFDLGERIMLGLCVELTSQGGKYYRQGRSHLWVVKDAGVINDLQKSTTDSPVVFWAMEGDPTPMLPIDAITARHSIELMIACSVLQAGGVVASHFSPETVWVNSLTGSLRYAHFRDHSEMVWNDGETRINDSSLLTPNVFAHVSCYSFFKLALFIVRMIPGFSERHLMQISLQITVLSTFKRVMTELCEDVILLLNTEMHYITCQVLFRRMYTDECSYDDTIDEFQAKYSQFILPFYSTLNDSIIPMPPKPNETTMPKGPRLTKDGKPVEPPKATTVPKSTEIKGAASTDITDPMFQRQDGVLSEKSKEQSSSPQLVSPFGGAVRNTDAKNEKEPDNGLPGLPPLKIVDVSEGGTIDHLSEITSLSSESKVAVLESTQAKHTLKKPTLRSTTINHKKVVSRNLPKRAPQQRHKPTRHATQPSQFYPQPANSPSREGQPKHKKNGGRILTVFFPLVLLLYYF
eukprot:Platyproteum_vivax@DN6564_c0_g1_i1.p1